MRRSHCNHHGEFDKKDDHEIQDSLSTDESSYKSSKNLKKNSEYLIHFCSCGGMFDLEKMIKWKCAVCHQFIKIKSIGCTPKRPEILADRFRAFPSTYREQVFNNFPFENEMESRRKRICMYEEQHFDDFNFLFELGMGSRRRRTCIYEEQNFDDFNFSCQSDMRVEKFKFSDVHTKKLNARYEYNKRNKNLELNWKDIKVGYVLCKYPNSSISENPTITNDLLYMKPPLKNCNNSGYSLYSCPECNNVVCYKTVECGCDVRRYSDLTFICDSKKHIKEIINDMVMSTDYLTIDNNKTEILKNLLKNANEDTIKDVFKLMKTLDIDKETRSFIDAYNSVF